MAGTIIGKERPLHWPAQFALERTERLPVDFGGNLLHGAAQRGRDEAEGGRFTIHAPLQYLSKAGIIRLGVSLGVDYGLTLSCYDPPGAELHCGRCDACRLRRAGFAEAGVPDPTHYQS